MPLPQAWVGHGEFKTFRYVLVRCCQTVVCAKKSGEMFLYVCERVCLCVS